MATGVGFSFDTSFLQNLEKADKKMEALMDKSNSLSASVVSAFSKMSKNGVLPYIESLESKIRTLNSIKFSIGENASSDMKKLKEETSNAIDVINKLLTTLKQRPEYYNEVGRGQAQKVIDEYNRELEATRNYTRQRIQMYSDMFDEIDRRENEKRQQNQQVRDNAVQARANYEATIRMYEQMYAQIDAKEKEKERRYLETQKREEEAAARKAKSVIDQANRELEAYRNAYKQRQQMYEQMWREIERRESSNRRGDYQNAMLGGAGGIKSADSALRYADRIYSDRGLRSVNNMQKAIQQMQQAQQRLNLNTEQGRQKYEQLDKEIKRVKGDIDRVTGASENLNKSHKGLLDTSGQLARAMAAVFSVSAIKGYVNKLMQIRGEFELQQRSLQVLLQNKDEANALWDKTVALAVKSPYTTKQLVTATKQLAAYRIESEKLYETNKMLADVSIGLGVDMNRLILAFGQVKAANFLRGTELRQFSEAGVNMLDELAKRFTMLEGRAVSVGEVFERVSKRMVSFADVEAVFKTITSEGGTFYQMQEKQSETLKGMMLNLKDSYELMLNDIGKSNEGMLKGFVSMMKTLVDNWQEIAFVVEKLGYALLTYAAVTKLAKFGSSDFATKLLTLGTGASFAGKAITFLSNALKGLKAGLIIGAITAVAYAIMELWRSSTKAKREAEQLQKELNSIYNEDYTNFKQQTENFENLVDRLQSVNQGSEEHREIIQKLNSQYGEYLGYIVTETTSYNKLFLSINKVNDAIIRKAKSATYEKAFSRAFEDTNQRISGYQEDLKKRIENTTVGKRGKDGLLFNIIPTEEELNDIFALFEKKVKESGENISQWYELQKIFKEYGFELGTPLFWDSSELINYSKTVLEQKEAELKLEQQINAQYSDTTAKTLEHRNALKQINETEKRRLEKAKKQGDTSSIAYQKEVDRIKKEAQISRIQAQVQYEGLDKDVANKRIAELNKFSDTVIDINNKIEASAEKLGEKYASIIYIDEAEAETGISQIAESTAQSYKTMQDVIKQQNALKEAGTVHDQNILENAEKTAAAYYYKLQLLGRLDLLQKEENKKETEALKLLNKQLSALKESKQTFDQLRQKFGLEEATKKTAKAFEDLFKELDMTAFTIDMTFDNQGMIDVINELPNKAGEAGKQAMEKLKAEMAGGIDVSVKVREDEDLLRQIENMLSGYELSIELQKLNIPPDLAKQLFNVDSISLPELKNQLVGMEDIFVGTEMEKQYRGFLQKVSQMEQKEQEERLKKYIAFSRKAMSERAKIKLEELQTIAEIEKTFAIKDEDSEEVKAVKLSERTRALAQARKDASDALQKLDWEAFKSSDTFNNIFDDLEHASDEVLKNVIQQLKDFKNQWKDMPFEQMRQVVDLLNKAEGALEESSNPFMEGTRLNKVIRKDGRTAQEAQLDIWQAEQQKRIAEEALSNYEIFEKVSNGQLKVAELSTEQQKEYAYWQDISVEQREELVGKIQNEVSAQNEAINKSNIHLNNIKKQKTSYEAQAQAIEQMNQMAQDLYNSFKGLHEALGGDSDSPEAIFAEMGMSVTNSVASMIQLQLELQAASVSATAFGAAMNTALGVIGWINMGVSVLTSVITAFTKAHDNKREKQIQKELDLVERLGKLYEKLEKQIEAAYSIDTFQAANDAAKENLEQQIRATERMIEAEKDKKKTDQKRIDEWREQIEENLELLEELEAKRLQELGGIGGEDAYKDIAQGFTDAWFDAFLETGNGLDALNDHFDEVLNNIVKKQLALRATNSFLAPIFEEIDKAVKDTKVTNEEMQKIKELAAQTMPELAAFLENIATEMGMSEYAGKNGELSGLSAGIQGITSEQSDILASYLNSIRFFVADSNMQLKALVAAQGVNADTPNPMLSQLLVIAEQTRSIRDMFESVIGRGGNNKHGGAYLKVDIG